MRSIGALSVALLAMLSLPATAEIYKCIDANGRPQFSDKPCAVDAEVVEVQDSSAGLSLGAEGDYSKMRHANKARELKRSIHRKEGEIRDLESTRDRKIADLSNRQRYAANNLAGATWEGSLATQMDAVSRDYNSRIDRKRKEADRLRDQLQVLEERQE